MIFAIFSATKPDLLGPAIQANYPGDSSLQVREGQWLVVDHGISSHGVGEKIGVTGAEKSMVGSALIVAVSGYSGRQSANVWEWMKAKLEPK